MANAVVVTTGAFAGACAIAVLDGLPLIVRAVVGSVAYHCAGDCVQVAVYAAATGEPPREQMRAWNYAVRIPAEMTGACLAVAAVVLRDVHPTAILLLALPYATTLTSGLQRIRLRHARLRDQAMLDLSGRVAAATSETEIKELVIEAACAVLDTPRARIGDEAPGEHEIGEPWGSGWLVAMDRRGWPTFNRPYGPEDRERLRSIALAGAAAAEHLALLDRLESMTLEDELTGLPNRRGGERALDEAWSSAGRSGQSVAVILLDLDRFKRINDTHGHPVGDRVLAQTGQRLRAATRSGETVARWGGEEFLAIVRCTPGEGLDIAERLRRAASMPIEVGGSIVPVSMSAGVAVWDPAVPAPSGQVIKAADTALYAAKRSGRDQAIEHHPDRAEAG